MGSEISNLSKADIRLKNNLDLSESKFYQIIELFGDS